MSTRSTRLRLPVETDRPLDTGGLVAGSDSSELWLDAICELRHHAIGAERNRQLVAGSLRRRSAAGWVEDDFVHEAIDRLYDPALKSLDRAADPATVQVV